MKIQDKNLSRSGFEPSTSYNTYYEESITVIHLWYSLRFFFLQTNPTKVYEKCGKSVSRYTENVTSVIRRFDNKNVDIYFGTLIIIILHKFFSTHSTHLRNSSTTASSDTSLMRQVPQGWWLVSAETLITHSANASSR